MFDGRTNFLVTIEKTIITCLNIKFKKPNIVMLKMDVLFFVLINIIELLRLL